MHGDECDKARLCILKRSTTASLSNCTSTSNTLAGYYAVDSTVNISTSASVTNLSRGYLFSASRGVIANCSATGDYMAAELTGISNDVAALKTSNLTAGMRNQHFCLRLVPLMCRGAPCRSAQAVHTRHN